MPKSTFKSIKKEHLASIEEIYLKSDPYSDFNVVSLWGYMIPGAKIYIDKNIAIFEMTDYNTEEKYFTLFGRDNPEPAISKLFGKHNDPIVFRHVPEDTFSYIRGSAAVIDAREDPDNNDYIFSVDKIARLDHEKYKNKRKSLRKFRAKFPDVTVRKLDTTSSTDRRRMYDLFRRWVEQSKSNDYQRELRALKRAIKLNEFPIICIGAFHRKSLIGFTVNEIEKHGYYQGHFGKANYRYPQLGLFLENETAKYLRDTYGCKFMNLQQDMGIEGIRYYKQSLHPEKQLRKYTVIISPKNCRMRT